MTDTTIKLRRSSVKGKQPTTEQLALGELAINTVDGKLYLKQKDSDGVGGAESIVQIGAAGEGALTASGTPSNNQLAVWTSATELEGDTNLTWDGSTFNVTGLTTLDSTTVSGDLTVSGTTFSGAREEYVSSNIVRVNQRYNGALTGSYFEAGEYQKVVTVTPDGSSENYQIEGKLFVQSGQSIQTINFTASLRSSTLPDLVWEIYYDEENTGTRWVKPVLWTKETTTAGFILAFEVLQGSIFGTVTADITIIPRIGADKPNIEVNPVVNSEQSAIDAGFTQQEFVRRSLWSSNNITIDNNLTVNNVTVLNGQTEVVTAPSGVFTENTNHDDFIVRGNQQNVGIQLFSATDTFQYLAFGDSAAANAGYIRYSHADDRMVLRAGATDTLYVTDDKVGINASSPASMLTIADADGGNSFLIEGASNNDVIAMNVVSGSTNRGEILIKEGTSGNDYVKFSSQSSTGNYIINNLFGLGTATPNRQLDVQSGDAVAARFNRQTNSGDIVELANGGTTVGRIGTSAGYMTVGTDSVGLIFNSSGTGEIYPWDLTNNQGNNADGVYNFGRLDRRWNNIYLTGRLTNDGTGGIAIDVDGHVDIDHNLNVDGVTTLDSVTVANDLTLSGLSAQASETTALVINGSNVVGTRDLGSNAFTSTSYAPIASPTFTGTVTTPNLTITNLTAQNTETTTLMINGSNVVGTRELGSNAFTSTSYLPLSGGTMTGNITFSDDGEGIVWSRNTDGAGIKFYNTADGDTNSRLEYYTQDNGNEYHRWVHFTPSSTEHELMTLRYGGTGRGDLNVTGMMSVDSDLTVAGSVHIDGNLTVAGTRTDINVDALNVSDGIVIFGDSNTSTDLIDLGFYGKYYDQAGGKTARAGLFRDASDGKFYLFSGLRDSATDAATTINRSGTNYTDATLVAGNLTLSGLSAQASETTSVMINGSGVLGTRDLGSNAFQSLNVMTTDTNQSVSGVKTLNNLVGIQFNHNGTGTASKLYRAGGNATRFEYYNNSFIFDAKDDAPWEIRSSNDSDVFQVDPTSDRTQSTLDFWGNVFRFPNLQNQASTTDAVVWNSSGGGLGYRALGSNAFTSTTYVPTTTTITSGAGLTGGGNLSTNRTLAVGAGDGITVGADSVSVDSTVVRTSGNQTIGGIKTFSSSIVVGANDNGGATIPGNADSAVTKLDGGANVALFAYNNAQSGKPVAVFFKGDDANNVPTVIVAGDADPGADENIFEVRGAQAGQGVDLTSTSRSSDTIFSVSGNNKGTYAHYGLYAGDSSTGSPTFSADTAGKITAVNLTLSGLANQASEATAVVINGSNVVGTRELGSNAFTSTSYVPTSRTITAGAGLTGGGDLSANRTLDVGAGDGISVATDTVAVDSTVVRTSGNQSIGGSKTFTSSIALETTGTDIGITFNQATATDAGADWGIRVNGEHLEFYEPEQTDFVHFSILDDDGVTSRYGYRVNGTMALDSNRDTTFRNISGSGSVTLSGLSNQASEATALMINGSNVVGTRELGTLAFSSATYDNYSSWTLSADGGTNQTINSGNTVDIAGGTYITTTAQATDTVSIAHDNTTRTDTTSNASPAHGATFTAVDGVTTNATGHITAINVKTVTLPSDNNTDTLQSIANDTTAADRFVTFVNSASGAQTGGSNAGLKYNPSTQDLTVGGKLSATTKSFDIPHPSKDGMRLRYGSLEGPENGVYVRGRVNGEFSIELPDYWLQLVDPESITVNLTQIGPDPVWVEDIRDNVIYIGGSGKCFYQVFGERVDVEKLKVEYRV